MVAKQPQTWLSNVDLTSSNQVVPSVINNKREEKHTLSIELGTDVNPTARNGTEKWKKEKTQRNVVKTDKKESSEGKDCAQSSS